MTRADFLSSELQYLKTDAVNEVRQHPSWERVKLEAIRLDDINLIERELAELAKES